MFKFVKIQGIPVKIIKLDGIWMYKHHFCLCGCGGRIQWNKHQKKNGIPRFIFGHQRISSESFKNQTAFLLEPTIIKNGIKYYEKLRCKCGCGRRIPYPITQRSIDNQKCYGIPKYITGHHSKETYYSKEYRKEMSKRSEKYYQEHPEKRKQISEKLKKYYIDNPEIGEKNGKFLTKYWEDNPEKRIEQIRKMNESKTFVSEPELIMRNYVIKLCVKYKINYLVNVHEIIGTPDIVILTNDGHPIALFEDGCHVHGCLIHFPLFKEKKQEDYEFHSFKRNYDRMINEKLINQGFRVVRIWQHDIKNGKYKKILKNLIKET